MKYHEGNILCLEYAEFAAIVPSKGTFDSLKSRGNITVYGRGGNGSPVLIAYETMPAKYKDEVKKLYGDPYKYISQQPILELIRWDLVAEQFYKDYVLPNGMKLPDQDKDLKGKPQNNYVKEYSTAASWLNTISYLTTDKRALKTSLNISIADFWNTITDLIRAKRVHLPASEKRLKERLKEYKGQNYACLIEAWRFGNSNSKKVDDDIAGSLLLEMIAHDHQHDFTVIASKYNQWAKEAGKDTITPGAVGYWAKKNAHLITQSREGRAKNYTKFVKYIPRERPSAPLLMVGSDDNVLDLYFRNDTVGKNGQKQKSYYYRPVLYVVMDAFNDYILGYAIGETVTIDLIRAAYLNAVHHIRTITGGQYLPHQIQMDRWGLDPKMKGELAQFYKSVAHATPAIAKASQGKYIERAFGVTWHQALKAFPNYSGHNIGAKERLSTEAIERSKKDFPSLDEASKYVEAFINHLRQSRLNDYLTAFNASEVSKEKAITTEKRLSTFGYLHADKAGKSIKNTLSPAGLRPTIEGKTLLYDIPESYFPHEMGKRVQVIYDPYDLSEVLVTDGKGLRFVAETCVKMPSALADFKPGDRTRLNNLIEAKKRIASVPGIEKSKRVELLERAGIDTESLLQSGVLIKEVRHVAERAVAGYMEEHPTKVIPITATKKKAVDDDEIDYRKMM